MRPATLAAAKYKRKIKLIDLFRKLFKIACVFINVQCSKSTGIIIADRNYSNAEFSGKVLLPMFDGKALAHGKGVALLLALATHLSIKPILAMGTSKTGEAFVKSLS